MYKHNLPSFTPDKNTPKLSPSGANNLYVGLQKRILRIIPASDMYVAFSTVGDGVIVASSTTGPLLKANQEYFLDCGDSNFMTASVGTADVTLLRQEGLSRF